MNGKNKKKKQEENRGNLELLVLLSCPDAVGERHIMLTARTIKFLDYLAFADSAQKKEIFSVSFDFVYGSQQTSM